MKKSITIFMVLSILVSLVSCTDNFDSINTNELGVKYVKQSEGGTVVDDASLYLPAMMTYIYSCNGGPAGNAGWVYQIQQNFNSDIYSGFWMQSNQTGFGKGANVETNYTLQSGWDDWLFSRWAVALASFPPIQSSAWGKPNGINKATLGMAYVTKVMLSERVADALGTIPYSSFGASKPSYDPLDKVYATFFNELDSALKYLSPTVTATEGMDATKDLFYAGDQSKWCKLANSLRLRLAMRIVKADPIMAKTQALKAINDPQGLILNNSENAAWKYNSEGALTTLVWTWGDGNTSPGADVGSYLVGYADPRLPVFLSPTDKNERLSSRIPLGGYCTMRLGTAGLPDSPNAKVYSKPGSGIPNTGVNTVEKPSSSTFFNAAETNFLLAEAVLRSWVSGSAQTYYESGIQASMNQWGVAIGGYLSSTKSPADYVDPVSADRDIKAVSTCKPSWSSASDNEGHLEQVITQKWLALWPANSPVAWSEYRRTGYPKLFPAYLSAVKPTITRGGKSVNNARKIRLPESEYTNNGASIAEAIKFLGGSDDITTCIWWDKDTPNF